MSHIDFEKNFAFQKSAPRPLFPYSDPPPPISGAFFLIEAETIAPLIVFPVRENPCNRGRIHCATNWGGGVDCSILSDAFSAVQKKGLEGSQCPREKC